MSPVVTETRDSLIERRDAILAALGMTADEFDRLTETRTLTGDEWEAREELDEIAFLLGE
jgi:hypothetical protein